MEDKKNASWICAYENEGPDTIMQQGANILNDFVQAKTIKCILYVCIYLNILQPLLSH